MCKWLTLRKGFYTMLLLSTRLVEVAGCPAPRPPAPVSSLLLRDVVRRLRPQSGDDKRHAVRPLHLSVAATCDVAASPVLITLSQSPDPREHRASSQLIIAITVSFVARCLPWAFADGSWLGAENTLAHLEASFVHIEATLVGALQSIHGNRAKLQSICMLPSMCKLLVSLRA